MKDFETHDCSPQVDDENKLALIFVIQMHNLSEHVFQQRKTK